MSSTVLHKWLIRLLSLICILAVSACGDSLNSADSTAEAGTKPKEIAVDRIEINPSNPSAAAGTQVALTVTAIMSDNTRTDVSDLATWTSSDSTLASVQADATNKPTAVALKAGNVNLVASHAGKQATAAFIISSATLVSVEVTPSTPSIANGTSQQFKATGVFTDNSRQDLTASVSWNSGVAATATVSNAAGSNGLATSLAKGTTSITAISGSITSPAVSLSVTAATLVSINVTPSAAEIDVGGAQQFMATATYSDNSTQDSTAAVTWTSTTASAAAISNASGSNGMASWQAKGSTQVTAVLGTVISNSATLTTNSNFTSPGSFAWTVPAGVSTIKVIVTGGGGGGSLLDHGKGGNGGIVTAATFSVTPGSQIPVVVGSGGGVGSVAGLGGKLSSFNDGATTRIIAGGGGGQGALSWPLPDATFSVQAEPTGGNGCTPAGPPSPRGGASQSVSAESGYIAWPGPTYMIAFGGSDGVAGVAGTRGYPSSRNLGGNFLLAGGMDGSARLGGDGAIIGATMFGGSGGTGYGNGGGGGGISNQVQGTGQLYVGGGGGGGGCVGGTFSVSNNGGNGSPGNNGSVLIIY